MFHKRTYCIFLLCFVCQLPLYTESTTAEISMGPSNLTVPLGQSPAVFQCVGRGTFLLWRINNNFVSSADQEGYENRGFRFNKALENGMVVNTVLIPASVENNNTQLRCHATGEPSAITSAPVNLTIAGPPLRPVPRFHVVNATHVVVMWDKPFALPEYDVTNYTLSILNTTSSDIAFVDRTFSVSDTTEYPIRYIISDEGNIPDNCHYLEFTLTASSQAGTSRAGLTTGGFPIAPSPIDRDSINHNVTFTTSSIPIVHINFTFPTVCDYQDANYTVRVRDKFGTAVSEISSTYNSDRPENVAVEIDTGLEKDQVYNVEIVVSTAVTSTTIEFKFDTSIEIGTGGLTVSTDDRNNVVIILSAVAGGLFIILLLFIMVFVFGFILRRRKLKRRMLAHQDVIRTDEAVQRAALAMVPNPIYSGNPIYDEIADIKCLQSLYLEPKTKDEGYDEISNHATNVMSGADPQLESKPIRDKCRPLPEETYTVMNPAGTLSNQTRTPTDKESPTLATMYNGGSEVPLSERRPPLPGIHRGPSNGSLFGLRSSVRSNPAAPASAQQEDEERYVRGAF